MAEELKYRYEFVDGTSVILDLSNDDPISKQWLELLLDMDRQERNNTQTEHRRHCSLDAYQRKGQVIPSPYTGFEELEERFTWNDICNTLSAREQEIGNLYFRKGLTQMELAKRFGLSQQRIAVILAAIRKKSKNF